MEKYVKGSVAAKILGVHQRTLYNWEEKGKIKTIRTPTNQRLYNVEDFLKDKESSDVKYTDIEKIKTKNKLKICYVRVSSHSQKDDMLRQEKLLKKNYPDYIYIKDIGSGINFNRKGLNKLIDLAIQGKVEELVIAHKDRLTRFGFELIERLITVYSGGKIIILDKEKELEPQEELVLDVLQILNVFTAKMNGLRKYKC